MSSLSMRLSCALVTLVSVIAAAPGALAQDGGPEGPPVAECIAQIEQVAQGTQERIVHLTARSVSALEELGANDEAPARAVLRAGKRATEGVKRLGVGGARVINGITARCVQALHEAGADGLIPDVLDAREAALQTIKRTTSVSLQTIADAVRDALENKQDDEDDEESEEDPASVSGGRGGAL
jgi:hypothetical protein